VSGAGSDCVRVWRSPFASAAPTAPIILPCALTYFVAQWMKWRYVIIHCYERVWETGGTTFNPICTQLVWCLFIMESFTGRG
jgi:Calcium-dependent channel, 7TM region, putative phosphate